MPFGSLLNKTLSVKRKSRVSDGKGGFTITTITILASVPSRICIKTAKEINLGETIEAESDYRILTYNDTTTQTIKLHDIFVDSSDEYEIMGIRRPSLGDHIEFDVVYKYSE